ncbi:MAG: hypothetical protein MJ252_16605 [archaeon]|nr:hypothetical protein [archaeon]
MQPNDQPKIIELCYKLNFPIERVYCYHNSLSLLSFLCNSNYKLTNLSRTPTLEGENFEGIVEPFGYFQGKCLKNIYSSNYKKLKSQLIFSQMRITITKEFYKIQKDNSTLHYNKVKIYFNPSCINDPTFDFDKIKAGMRKTSCCLIKEAIKALSSSPLFLQQVESCLLKCPLEEVLAVLKDLDKFNEICPSLKCTLDSLAFISSRSENIIKLRYDKGFAVMRMVEENIKNLTPCTKNCKIILDLLWGEPKIPLQKVTYSLSRITNTQTHLLLKHEFKEPICTEFINFLENSKKVILRELQNYFLNKAKK